MKQKQLIAICLIINSLVVLLCGCGGIDKEKLAKLKKELQKNSTSVSQTSTEATTIETTTEETSYDKKETSLMFFLDDADKYGYSIENPSKIMDMVTALAIGENAQFYIRYTSKKQHISMVEVIDDKAETRDEYKKCIIAMAKAFNPNIDKAKLNSSIEKAIKNCDKPFKYNDMYFNYDSQNESFAISYW